MQTRQTNLAFTENVTKTTIKQKTNQTSTQPSKKAPLKAEHAKRAFKENLWVKGNPTSRETPFNT